MSPLITYLLIGFLGLYLLFIIVELLLNRLFKRFLIQGICLIAVLVILYTTTGFPVPRTTFGSVSPILTLVFMFIATILGIAAHYLFYLKDKFSWISFIKPLIISPIVFLPMVGSVQGTARLEYIQLLTFSILAFQNGFFWKQVLEHAKPKS
jgi:hypothetical protein